MTHFPPLLSDAPVGRHVCQFHKDAHTLTVAVAGFVDVGLYRREAVIVVATQARRAAVLRRLAASRIDTAAVIATGQFVLLDAEELLARFMVDGMPDTCAFREVVLPVLDASAQRGYSRVRVYGEMVNVLWQDGHPDAAVRLEELWNELAAERAFSLFCGYELDCLDPRTYAMPLDSVARTHSDVVESVDDERLRTAVDAATSEILGLPLSTALTYFGKEGNGAERRLPAGQRTLLWLHRNMPSSMVKVLARARAHFAPV